MELLRSSRRDVTYSRYSRRESRRESRPHVPVSACPARGHCIFYRSARVQRRGHEGSERGCGLKGSPPTPPRPCLPCSCSLKWQPNDTARLQTKWLLPPLLPCSLSFRLLARTRACGSTCAERSVVPLPAPAHLLPPSLLRHTPPPTCRITLWPPFKTAGYGRIAFLESAIVT